MSRAGVDVIIPREQLLRVREELRHVGSDIHFVCIGAVNETTKEVRTRISNKIRGKVAIKKADLDPTLKTERADKRKPTGRVVLSESTRIPLKYFSARQVGKGVSYKIAKEGGRPIATSAFGPEIPRLGRHVYKRFGQKRKMTKGRYKGKLRQPIRMLKGPSPWGVFVLAKLEPETLDFAQAALEKNVEQRLNYLLKKARGEL